MCPHLKILITSIMYNFYSDSVFRWSKYFDFKFNSNWIMTRRGFSLAIKTRDQKSDIGVLEKNTLIKVCKNNY